MRGKVPFVGSVVLIFFTPVIISAFADAFAYCSDVKGLNLEEEVSSSRHAIDLTLPDERIALEFKNLSIKDLDCDHNV